MFKLLKRYKLEVVFLSIVILFFVSYIEFGETRVFSFIKEASNNVMLKFSDYGLIGVSLASFIGNSSVIIQVPYYLVVFVASISATSLLHIFWIGLVTGVGAGLGEFVAYFCGKGISHTALSKLRKSSLFRFLEKTVNKNQKYIPILVYLFALTPLPDDTLILPLGMAGYDFKKLIIPVFLGKICLGWILSFGFVYFTQTLSKFSQIEPSLDVPFLLICLFALAILYQVMKYEESCKKNNGPAL